MSSDDYENGQSSASSSGSSPSPWEPVKLVGGPQQSQSGGRATTVGLIVFFVIFAGLVGWWIWYGATNSAGIPPWALLEIGVLAAALSTAALLALTVGAVKGIAIVIGWLAGRIFWLILIVGGIFVAERAGVAYFQGHWDDTPIISDCHLCSSIRPSVVSAISNAWGYLPGPESSRSVGADGLTCLNSRNEISGRVSNIQSEGVMSVVTVKANVHEQLMSALTSRAVVELGLKENDSVVALVKATDIRMVKGNDPDTVMLRSSAQNRFRGHVVEIQKGNMMGCLTIAIASWKLTSAMTPRAMDALQFKNGDPVTAIFKAADVLLEKHRS